MNIVDAALKYAAEGIPIFPLHNITPSGIPPCSCANAKCENIAKHPRTAHGFKDATRDEKTIREWWVRWPTANIGIPTGETSGLVVLDIDSLETKDKLKEVVSFNSEPKVRTARGFHVYYRYDGRDFRNKAGVIPGLDFRGSGGYVVAPPSIHATKKKYAWQIYISDDNLHPVPPDLEKLLTMTSQRQPASDGYRERFNTAGALQGVPEGQRDETVFKLACKLRNADVPPEMAEALITESAKNCDPPFPERIALDKVARVYRRYEVKQPTEKKQAEIWPEFVSAERILSEPDETIACRWEECLPVAGSSLLVAPPKIGKTTLAANLVICVSRGIPFLGRETQQCAVAYAYLDGPRREIKDIFKRLGLKPSDPIFVHAGAAPRDYVGWIMAQVKEHAVRFFVIDTFQKFFKIDNINDYSEVVNKSSPMLDAAASENVHLLFLHHAGKSDRDDLDSAIGSTALRGQVQSYLHLKLLPGSTRRIFRTDQRYGQGNFSEVAIGFDRRGWLEIKGSREDAEIQDCKPQIHELLEAENGELTEKQIRTGIPVKAIVVSKALREMFKTSEVERTGEGKKNRPFRYSLAISLLSNSEENDLTVNAQHSRLKGGFLRGENDSCPNSYYIGNGIPGHESKSETQISEKPQQNSSPDPSGHERDMNGHEWDAGTRIRERKKEWEDLP